MFNYAGNDNNLNSQFSSIDIGDGNGNGRGNGVISEDEIREFAKQNGLTDTQADELVDSFGSGGENGWDKAEFESSYKAITAKFGQQLHEQFRRMANDDGSLDYNEFKAYSKTQDKTDTEIKAAWNSLTGGGANGEKTSISFEQFSANKDKAQEAEKQAVYDEIAGPDGAINYQDYQKYMQKKGFNAAATDAGWQKLSGSDTPAQDAVVDKSLFDKNFKAAGYKSGFVQDGGNSQAITREHVKSWVNSNPNFANYDQDTKNRILDDTFHTLNGDVFEDISADDYASGYDKGKSKFDAYSEFAAIDKDNDGKFNQADFTKQAKAQGMTQTQADALWKKSAGDKTEITMDDYLNPAKDSSNRIRDTMQLGLASATPQGSTTTPKGSTTTPQGSTTTPQGSTTTPQGSTTTPQGSTTTPQGSTTTPQGSTTTPQGSTTTPQGSTTTPQGSTTTPKDSTTTPKDSTVPRTPVSETASQPKAPATKQQIEDDFTALTGSENQKQLDKKEFIEYATQKGITNPEAAWSNIAGKAAKIAKEDFINPNTGIRNKFEKLFADEAKKDGETIASGSSAITGKPDSNPKSDAAIPKEQLEKEFEALTGFKDQKELNKNEFIKYAKQKGFEDPEAAWSAIAGKADSISKADYMDPKKDFRAKIEERVAGEAKEEGDTIDKGTSAILGKKDSKPGAASDQPKAGSADQNEDTKNDAKNEEKDADRAAMDVVTAHWNKWSEGGGKVSRDTLSEIANKRGDYAGISDEESNAARYLISDNRFAEINKYAQGSSADDKVIGRADIDAYKFDHGMGTPTELDMEQMVKLGDKFINQWKDKNGEIKFSDLEKIAADENRPSEERKVAQFMVDNKDDVFEALDTIDHGGDDDIFNVDQWNKYKEDSNVDRFIASEKESAAVVLSKWNDWAKGDGVVSKSELEKIADPENGYSAQEQDAAAYILKNFDAVRNTDTSATKKDDQLATVNIDKFLSEKDLNGKTKVSDYTAKEAGKAAQGYWDNWKSKGNDEIVSIKDLEAIVGDSKRPAAEQAVAQWLLDHSSDIFDENDNVDTEAFNSWVNGL